MACGCKKKAENAANTNVSQQVKITNVNTNALSESGKTRRAEKRIILTEE